MDGSTGVAQQQQRRFRRRTRLRFAKPKPSKSPQTPGTRPTVHARILTLGLLGKKIANPGQPSPSFACAALRLRLLSDAGRWHHACTGLLGQGQTIGLRRWAHPTLTQQRCPSAPPIFPRIQPPRFPGTKQPAAAELDAATGWFQCGNARGAGSGAPKFFAGRTVVGVFAASLGHRGGSGAARPLGTLQRDESATRRPEQPILRTPAA